MKSLGRRGAHVRRDWRYVELRFEDAVTQTRMLRWAPDVLCVPYTRTMLAALWLHPTPRNIGIVGLGGGAQAKFCHRHLGESRIEAVENDAGVLALRDAFGIPPDDGRLQVTRADGREWLAGKRGAFDLLLVDAYGLDGIPAHLSGTGFYEACRAALSADGVMASNFYQADAGAHQARMQQVFHGRSRVLPEPAMSNHVGFAWNGDPRPQPPARVLRSLPWSARWQLRDGFRRLAGAFAG